MANYIFTRRFYIDSISRRNDDYAGKEKVLPFYIRSPDEAVLRSRLEKRGEREDSIERRLKESKDWDVQADESGIPYFYITNNGTLEEAVGQVKKYLQ